MIPGTTLTRDSYIVYIALIAMYLVLILFFFPETKYVYIPSRAYHRKADPFCRNMTIEEVSVLFDTGRKGDAQAAARQLDNGRRTKEEGMVEDIDDAEKQPATKVVSHAE